MLEAVSITFGYLKCASPVFRDFTARFVRGEIVALCGKNGCGKTTLTKLLVGILRPSSGQILIDGNDISGMSLFDTGKRVGYVFQNPNRQLFCDTVYNEIAYGLRNSGMGADETNHKVNSCLKLFGLERYTGVFPGKLSLGEKQRVALAAVLALGTDYLVMDEPTSGLDVRRQAELGDMLVKLRIETRCGIVIASHEIDFIDRYADRELVIAL